MSNDLEWLIGYLLGEMPAYREQAARFEGDRFSLFRALVNLRPPSAASAEFLARQDALLQSRAASAGVTDADALAFDPDGLCLWRGDITLLRADAIVNAANSALLGCFCPNHGCIDNAIHTFAGVQLRAECARIMRARGREEAPGQAVITPAFNLPSRFILHTVGPIVTGAVTDADREALSSCYIQCLNRADEKALRTVAFCCISTGEFRFPNEEAANIAVSAVRGHAAVRARRVRVIFNVFKARDERLYRRILSGD